MVNYFLDLIVAFHLSMLIAVIIILKKNLNSVRKNKFLTKELKLKFDDFEYVHEFKKQLFVLTSPQGISEKLTFTQNMNQNDCIYIRENERFLILAFHLVSSNNAIDIRTLTAINVESKTFPLKSFLILWVLGVLTLRFFIGFILLVMAGYITCKYFLERPKPSLTLKLHSGLTCSISSSEIEIIREIEAILIELLNPINRLNSPQNATDAINPMRYIAHFIDLEKGDLIKFLHESDCANIDLPTLYNLIFHISKNSYSQQSSKNSKIT